MQKNETPSNFIAASFALLADDYRGFSHAITAEMKRDPIGARDIVESSMLKLSREAGSPGSPAKRMLLKAVDVLYYIAPIVAFNTDERNLTLRALSVAEAACSWASEATALGKIEEMRSTIETTSARNAFSAAVRAGVIAERTRTIAPHVPVGL